MYGEYPNNISFKYAFDFIYSRTDVEFRWQNPFRKVTNNDWSFGTNHMYLDLYNSHHFFAFKDRKTIVPHKDYEWVEVTRSRTDCILYQYISNDEEKKKQLLPLYYEGYSRGWPDHDTYGTREPQAYGCWFNIATGTGIFVNIGKTLVSMSRNEANKILGISSDSDDSIASDFQICSKVIEKGYDSIQMYNSHPPLKEAELVYCTGKCATDPVKSACPPVELRTGWNATKRCECNDTFPIVNCNNKLTDIRDCFNIKEPGYRLKQTCYFEDFQWNNVFSTGWDGSIGVFILWDRNGVQSLPKLKTVMSLHQQGGWNTVLAASGLELMDTAANHTFILESMNKIGFDIVPILHKSNQAMLNKKKFNFHMLSLTVPGFLRSTVLNRVGVKIGFISYSLKSLNTDDLSSMAQLVLDEAICVKRLADIVILLSASDEFVDTYIAKKVNKFVDMIVGGNAQEHLSCNDKWHTSNEDVIIRTKHDSSLIKISIDVVDKNSFAFKSSILDISGVDEDESVKKWMMEHRSNII